MNQVNTNDYTQFNLPNPVGKQNVPVANADSSLPSSSSTGSSKDPATNLAGSLPQVVGAVSDPISSSGTISPPANTSNSDPDDLVPAVAEDSDLIEQEWVDKAKNIVEQTKQDPHKQNLEINKMKAVYIKKRYDKDIKIPNE